MALDTEVLVVGGGATGVGVARDLALRDLDVTLVDRSGLASGTSGRSHGLLHSGARYADTDPVGAEECIEENRTLSQIAGECVRDSGGMFVQLAADDPDYFDRKREACKEVGIPTYRLDGESTQAAVPGLSGDVVRGLEVPDGVVFPSRLVAATAADAEQNGARVYTDAPVEAMTVTEGRITEVEVGGRADEAIRPEYVVNAAGPWAGRVAALANADLAMKPTKGVMVAVEYDGLEPVLNRCREPSDGDIVVPHEGEVVLGTTSEAVEDPDDYPREEAEGKRVIEECAAMLPEVADAPIARTWWGVRPLYAPDEATNEGRGVSRGFFVLDHADGTVHAPSEDHSIEQMGDLAADGVGNFASVVGGKLTTHRLMAEVAADLVAERLGVRADCETADRKLPGAEDPERLDEFVDRFDGQGPADETVVTGPPTDR